MWYNPLITTILRSPLHGLLSKHMLLLTYTGHKTGTQHTLPVSYLCDGDRLTVISFRHRTWWRNFRDGGRVTLQLRGTTVPAFAQAITNEDVGLTSHLTALITKHPRYAKYLGITISADGAPASSAVAKAAETHVLVHLALGSVLNTVAEPHKEDTGYVHEHRA